MPRTFALTLALLAGCPVQDFGVQTLEPAVSVTPLAIDFGDTPVPTAAGASVYVTNAGKADLEVDLARLAPADPAFALEAEAPFSLRPDESATLRVTFTPPTYLPYATTLRIGSNDPEQPEILVPIQGAGVYAPLPDIEPSTTALDFGSVDAGNTSLLYLTILNLGDAPLHLADVSLSGDPSIGLASTPSGATVGAGEALPVLLTYTPADTDGDEARLTIASDDPDEPTIDVVVLGNGGSGFAFPVAVIDCPANAAPPAYVVLDGSDSYDPGGAGIVAWQWALVARPDGSQASFTALDGAVSQLFADSAGDYTAMLTVMNGAGVFSAPTFCDIEAVPDDALHLELTWDGLSSDLDLHLREEGAALFETPADACWCNDFPSWGAGGTDDDPRLDLDDLAGKGPENINILAPSDGVYRVAVHYFDDDYDGLVTATVRAYIHGVLAWEGASVLDVQDVWEVGTVDWPSGTFTPDGALSSTTLRGCY